MNKLANYALLLIGYVCFLYGIFLPIIRLPHLEVWADTRSVLDIIHTLYAVGEHFLAGLIFLLGIVLTTIKFLYLAVCAGVTREEILARHGVFRFAEYVSSLSMHVVLGVALAIGLSKLRGAYDPTILSGAIVYGFSVALVSIVQSRLRKLRNIVVERPLFSEVVWWKYPALQVAICASILCGAGTLFMGITEPVVQFTKLFVFPDEYSVVSLTESLYYKEKWFLCGVMIVFSIVFPIIKLLGLIGVLVFGGRMGGHKWVLHLLEWLGKYSMTDIMVLPLMLAYMNASGYVTSSSSMVGAYWFTTSVCVTMLGYMCAPSLARTMQARREMKGVLA